MPAMNANEGADLHWVGYTVTAQYQGRDQVCLIINFYGASRLAPSLSLEGF